MTMFGAPKRPRVLNDLLRQSYDTALTPQQETGFQSWRAGLPQNLQGTEDYDLRGAYLGAANEAANGHLPDTWKKPNHMTFSQESIYSSPEHQGGRWVDAGGGKWVFFASPENMRQHDPATIVDYFRNYEPDANALLPINWKLK
jgi:hypothetical protein